MPPARGLSLIFPDFELCLFRSVPMLFTRSAQVRAKSIRTTPNVGATVNALPSIDYVKQMSRLNAGRIEVVILGTWCRYVDSRRSVL